MATVLPLINLGPAPNTNQGDPLRVGGGIINDNTNTLQILTRTVEDGDRQTFKFNGNTDINTLEVGDMVSGWINSNRFFEQAQYNGGDVTNPASYTVFSEVDLSTGNNRVINTGIIANGLPVDVSIDGTEQFVYKDVNNGNELKTAPVAVIGNLVGVDVFRDISEGGNTGQGTRYRSNNPDFYGDIGQGAIDLTFSATNSTTIGATGTNAVAFGLECTASGTNSLSFGQNSIAAGNNSIAGGNSAQANSSFSIAFGEGAISDNIAIGSGSLAAENAIAIDADAIGDSSLAMMSGAIASGNAAIAVGQTATAQGDDSIAFGVGADAQALDSVAIGTDSISFSEREVNLGSFPTTYTPVINDSDRIFNVAIGPSSVQRADGLTILKDGRTGIGLNNFETTTNTEILQVNGATRTTLVHLVPTTFANLPASPNAGDVAVITDGSGNSSYRNTQTGGGANFIKILFDGTNWINS